MIITIYRCQVLFRGGFQDCGVGRRKSVIYPTFREFPDFRNLLHHVSR